jgi:hypothetical protein
MKLPALPEDPGTRGGGRSRTDEFGHAVRDEGMDAMGTIADEVGDIASVCAYDCDYLPNE